MSFFPHCVEGVTSSGSSCQQRATTVGTAAGPANAAFSVNSVFCGLISLNLVPTFFLEPYVVAEMALVSHAIKKTSRVQGAL